MKPFAIDFSQNRIGVEIMSFRLGLVGHHIHVSLKHHCRSAFFTRRCRHTHSHVADWVGLGFDVVSFSKFKKEFADFALLF